MDDETIRERLAEHGRRRAEALEQADRELDAIAELLPHAQAAGVNLKQVHEITGVSRPTLYARRPTS